MPPAAPALQQHAGGGLALPWMLTAPQLSAAAPTAQFAPPTSLPAAYASGLLPSAELRAPQRLSHWQPDTMGDQLRPRATPRLPGAAFWQGLPPTPRPNLEGTNFSQTFQAFQPPAMAPVATSSFPPLPAALQRRHTWSDVTAPANTAVNAALAAVTARLAQRQPGAAGTWPVLSMQDQVTPRPTIDTVLSADVRGLARDAACCISPVYQPSQASLVNTRAPVPAGCSPVCIGVSAAASFHGRARMRCGRVAGAAAVSGGVCSRPSARDRAHHPPGVQTQREAALALLAVSP